MSALSEHPTVRHFQEHGEERSRQNPRIASAWLKQLCLEAGADGAGFVPVESEALAAQKAEILSVLPGAKTAIAIVCRMNREPIRSVARSMANQEFHRVTEETNEVAAKIVSALEAEGIRATNAPAGFPMEMSRFPTGKVFVVSHKPIAVAAGLGKMGIHRNVIHPKFGSFILLNTVLLEAEVTEYHHPIDYNPCLECKLCVAACPTGAIGRDGYVDFSACLTHNYREFLGGFTDWVDLPFRLSGGRGRDRAVSDGPAEVSEGGGEAPAREGRNRVCEGQFGCGGSRVRAISCEEGQARG